MNETAHGVMSFAVGAIVMITVIVVVFYPSIANIAAKMCAQIGSVFLT